MMDLRVPQETLDPWAQQGPQDLWEREEPLDPQGLREVSGCPELRERWELLVPSVLKVMRDFKGALVPQGLLELSGFPDSRGRQVLREFKDQKDRRVLMVLPGSRVLQDL